MISPYRRKKIGEDYSKSVVDIYEDWPILKSPKAFELINEDYRLAGFGLGDFGSERFGELFEKIVTAKPFKHSPEIVEDLLERLGDANLNEGKIESIFFTYSIKLKIFSIVSKH